MKIKIKAVLGKTQDCASAAPSILTTPTLFPIFSSFQNLKFISTFLVKHWLVQVLITPSFKCLLKFLKLRIRWILEYADCILFQKAKTPTPKRYPGYDTKLHLTVRLQFWTYFIGITSRSTLIRNDCTCYGLFYDSNRSVKKLTYSIGPCAKNI